MISTVLHASLMPFLLDRGIRHVCDPIFKIYRKLQLFWKIWSIGFKMSYRQGVKLQYCPIGDHFFWEGQKKCQKRRIFQQMTWDFDIETRVWRTYSNIWLFLIQMFIRIFVRIIFWKLIYLDIRSCELVGYKYIRIFVRRKIFVQIYLDISLYQF